MAMVAVFSGWPGSPGTELLPRVCCQAASAKHAQLASFWLLAHGTKSAIMMVPTVGLQSPSPQSCNIPGDKRAWMQGRALQSNLLRLVLNYVSCLVLSTRQALLSALPAHCLTASSKPWHARGTDIISVLQMGKLSHREVRWIAQGHALRKQQSHIEIWFPPYFKAPMLAIDFKEQKVWRCAVTPPGRCCRHCHHAVESLRQRAR